jgi:hypothetical protein
MTINEIVENMFPLDSVLNNGYLIAKDRKFIEQLIVTQLIEKLSLSSRRKH